MAEGPPGYLRAWFEHYDNLSRESFDRFKKAVSDSQLGNYGADRFVSDWVSVGAKALLGPWSRWLGEPPALSILFKVGASDAEDTTTVFPLRPGDPVSQDLTRIGGTPGDPNDTIAAADVISSFEDGRTTLRVELQNLATPPPTLPALGDIFVGTVLLDGEVLAFVRVVVMPG